MAMFDWLRRRKEHPPSVPQAPAPRPAPVGTARYRFVAIDVETANPDTSSICQIGVAAVRHDGGLDAFCSYVDPEMPFDPAFTAIHGIAAATVRGAPPFGNVLHGILNAVGGCPFVQHSDFDRRAILARCHRHDIAPPDLTWIDSVGIARRAWPELTGAGGHGLANLRQVLGLDFRHHDAGEDARAAAEVVLKAEAHTGRSFLELSQPTRSRTAKTYAPHISGAGNADGPLAGNVAVFTGALTISRADAAALAIAAGVSVAASVTSKTTLVVVGEQDLTLLVGHTKSAKHRKAEALIADGAALRIIGEAEFLRLVGRAK